MWEFLEEGIALRRKHLGVGVDVYAFPLRLYQQLLKVFQVVAADQYARTLPDSDIDPCDFRIAVCRGVGLVEQRGG